MEGKNGNNSSSSQGGSEGSSSSSWQRLPPTSTTQGRPPVPPPPARVQQNLRPHPPPSRGSRGRPRVYGRMPPFMNLHAIPVGGSSSSAGHHHAPAPAAFAVDDAAARKEVRDQEMLGPRGGGRGGGRGGCGRGGRGQFPFTCTLCGRDFVSDKSLFGHMRSHGDRDWRGAMPPPVFSREEFADMAHLLNPEVRDDEMEEGEIPVARGGDGGIPGGDDPGQGGRVQYLVPDLNLSPPKEGKADDDN